MQSKSQMLPECMDLIGQTTHNFTIQQLPKRVVLLMGSSKAGKTTLLYYLLGKPLKQVTNDLGVSVLQPEAIYQHAYIGDGYESTTVYPNIPPDCGVDDLIIIDMPGFDDSRSIYKLINFYILLEIVKMVQEVHVCQVIEQMFVDSDQLQNQIQKICGFINQKILQTQHALSFIITKVEDQECVEKLQANLQSIISENQNENIKKQLQTFLTNKKYVFKNEQPKTEQGTQLKQKIIEESVFVKIDKKVDNFLSPTFCDHMIGETNLNQFRDYLSQLLSQTEFTILHLNRLVFAMIRYEYSETIAFFVDSSAEDTKARAFADIQTNKLAISVHQINQIQTTSMNSLELSRQSHQKLIKILKFENEFTLNKWIQSLTCWFQNCKTEKTFPEVFIEALHYTFKQLHILLGIFISINNQLKDIIDKLLQSSSIKGQVIQFTRFWRQNIEKLSSKQDMPQSTNELYQIYCSQFCSSSIREQIVYQYSYKQIKNQQIKKLIRSPPKRQSQKQVEHIKKLSFTTKQIQKLPLNLSVLQHILEAISNLNEKDENLKVLVNKAGEIFIHFSYFEQALMFYMALSDHQTITDLLQVGLHQGLNISTQFMKQILIKYLRTSDWDFHRQICICYDYLCSTAQTQEQFIQSQLEFVDYLQQSLGKITNPRENISTRNAVELYYIQTIIQERNNYIKLLQLLQKQYQESPCSAIFPALQYLKS